MFRSLICSVAVAFLFSCNGKTDKPADVDIPSRIVAVPQTLTYTIDSQLPHDTSAYTQGLEFYNGKLIESTGDFENSSLRIIDPRSGKTEKIHKMGSKDIFGEGLTILNDTLYQLTWTNNLVYVYNAKDITKAIKTLKWPHEGWGITNDGTHLIISDGSSTLYFVSPQDLRIRTQITVADNNGLIDNLNELEFVNGFIYANVYQTDIIIKIDPSNGNVVGKLSFPNLIQTYSPKEVTNRTDVMNGIAYDNTTNRFYVTGKRWPKMFRFSLNN
jgi:glutaminyl-peptide cyclotransferase